MYKQVVNENCFKVNLTPFFSVQYIFMFASQTPYDGFSDIVNLLGSSPGTHCICNRPAKHESRKS